MIARVVFRIVEVKFEDYQSSVPLAILKLYLNNTENYSGNPQTLPQQYGTLLWQSSNFTSTIQNTTLAILKLYLNNTEHSSGNPQTLPQQYGTLL
jgi:REP element-mobilizing transposase RayT